MLIIAALIVAGVFFWGTHQVRFELKAARDELARARSVALLRLFAPAIAATAADPRALLVWHPLARTVRAMFPIDLAALDRAAGATFPFTTEQIDAAHAQWTADWLAWERTHDAEYKVKAAALEEELRASNGSPIVRARLEAVEREKLDLYQRRYQEYVRVAKALQALTSG